MLSGTPHLLSDTFGNQLSGTASESLGEISVDVMLRGKPIGKLRVAAGQENLLKRLVEGALEAEMKASQAAVAIEESKLLADDLDYLLDLSELESIPLGDLLKHILRLFRAHLWVERACIYGMLDGFSLEGLACVGWDNDDWKQLYSSVAGVSASTKAPFAVNDPAKEKHLSRAGQEGARNLLCFPLLHGSTLVGVMTLLNRVGAPFGEADNPLIRRFANIAGHLLQKHMFKTRMEEFERTNDNLGKYLSKKVVKNVEKTQELELGGVEKKVVCLFSDIRGYTSITEVIAPATLVKLLNFHFERMHAIIEKNEGTLDKIVGDLIMAVWNIPKDQPDPELLAMKAALEMQKEMIRTVIPEWQRNGVEKVGMGVGVNAGLALAGNLGSSRFMNYTVIGDAVNTAQRLESKARAGEIWMNEEMYPLVHGKLEKPLRRELEIRLKGKEQTINALVYRPLSY
jgi:class 3 adenylate cyclase